MKLLFLAIASESLYLFLALGSRTPAEESLLAAWYRPVLFEQTPEFLIPWVGLFILYALAIRASSGTSRPSVTLFVFASGALFRATLALSAFPAVPRFAFLHGPSPVAELLMALAEPLFAGPGAARRSLTIGLDLLALALAPRLLRSAGRPTGLALVQAWNPLLVKEVAGTARLEIVLAMTALLLAMRLAQRSRRVLAALALGLGMSGWLGTVSAGPAMARALGARVAASLALAGALSWWAVAGLDVPWVALVGWPPESGVGGSLFPVLGTLSALLVSRSPAVPLVLAASIWAGVTLVSLRRLRDDGANLPAVTLPAFGFLVFLSPEVMPWGFLPFAYLAPHSANRGWLVFTATAPLTYLAVDGNEWSFWLGFLQYFPAYASLIFIALGAKRSGEGA